MSDSPRHTNRLIDETSPYLLQHAHNPVDWHPWGPEAFQLAHDENRPVFLSIGYSACHWCHVMERESFENEEIAAILNRDFVSIKVDREERPDVDSIYMNAVQLMTGHGGWPMSVFLTPDGTPFFGGTYFPPDDRQGMPGFRGVLGHVVNVFRNHPDRVDQATSEIRKILERSPTDAEEMVTASQADLSTITQRILSRYDSVHGGFGTSPKFPPAMTLEFLLQESDRTGDPIILDVVTHTLTKMARGGIYDQIGGGFHRYSTDARWLAPHFEKMLYDNALLVRLYTRAWQSTQTSFFAEVALETLSFIEREMTSPDGGFYSTLDADSEGEEGRFYVWQRDEVMDLLGTEEGRIFCALFDITAQGNWEGANIANVPRDPAVVAGDLGVSADELHDIVARGKCKLFGRRSERVRPARDEKILAGWNGWMLAAVSEAALAFEKESLQTLARRNADFLIANLFFDGRLQRSFKDGKSRIRGLLEDYSGVAWGLIMAFEATQERRYLDTARQLVQVILDRFPDPKGGFYDTPDDHESLITRPKEVFDNATPSGNSVTVDVLLRLALYFDEPALASSAREAIDLYWSLAQKYPSGFGHLLGAAGWTFNSTEIAITGDSTTKEHASLRRAINSRYLPHRIFVWKPADLPLMSGKAPEEVAVWICHDYHCEAPVTDVKTLEGLLKR